jgi:hypothetical protein
MSDMEIEVTETEEKPIDKEPEVVVETAKEPLEQDNGPAIKVEDAIAELRSRLEEEQKIRREAEKRAREFESISVKAQSEVHDTNLHLLTSAIDSIKRDTTILKANYRAALSSGNYEEAAEIQEQMSTNATKLMRLEDGKAELEKQPKPEIREVPRSADPVDEFVSRLSPASARWVKAHPECVTNPGLNEMMIAAHTIAMRKNIPVDTPEYFRYIEDTLGYTQEAPKEVSEPVQAPSGGRQAAPSPAPVSRAASTTGASRPNVVRLSEAEREIADMLGMDYKEYAKNKIDLQKAGRLN